MTASDETRRFTDREVAVILRHASEIDEQQGSAPIGGGLSLDELKEIAGEVGISPVAIERAVARLRSGSRAPTALTGAPLARKAVRAIPRELDRDGVARLVRIIDDRTHATGTISEALGSVRWTSSDRLRSSLVSITPAHGETTIQVVEKALPRIRRIFHFIPAAWGVMLAAPLVGMAGAASGTLAALGTAAIGAVVGLGAGRGAWNLMSAQSARRVERLAAELAEDARLPSGPSSAPPGAE